MTSSNRKFEDRVAIVTGAGSGVGASTAMLFAREGAKVWMVDRTRETAHAATYLASDVAGFVTGMALVIDGGIVLA